MHTHPNNIDRKEQTHREQGRLYPPPIASYLLSMQSFPRTEKTEKNLFYLHVIESELVGGIRERERRREGEERVSAAGKALTARRSKIAWMVRIQNNSLFLPDPNFNHSGWIIHSRPMTCREGDKESLLYFDSHNKFMTRCLKGRRNRQREGGKGRRQRAQVGLWVPESVKQGWNRKEQRKGNRRSRNKGSWVEKDVKGLEINTLK